MKIGVLALQGAVKEHLKMIENAGAEAIVIKTSDQCDEIDGIIIPGGESTTIGRLMKLYGFIEKLNEFSKQRKPIFGTCAGMILLAKEVVGKSENHLGLMDMKVARNAFGRQRESFEANLPIKGLESPLRAVFIRAPLIEEVGSGVEVLSEYNGKIVAARQGHLLAASFHPELTDDFRLHSYFINMVKQFSLVK
ncbi:pyridoxal 5'-phosphate synthase glutaminase subunit PdxT [Chengkuizengella marina]|uniref:Pyridoxal 5'-phosphate synthase subunit PdxT n=1 Tax=Chengkuizengella marina TaxID=2507566 RepID=A0A6N9Q7Q5_9BACL|nr:pyridoxal 5'-phosphate synthase glutaminase subunit PdxT [Chengkuizengella marina]NBI30664.1 pyridoxal 5'-phosphate synthase glutaminase subunit PdxT [Chengkuizengella marina]